MLKWNTWANASEIVIFCCFNHHLIEVQVYQTTNENIERHKYTIEIAIITILILTKFIYILLRFLRFPKIP